MAKQAKKFSKVVRDLESIIGAPVLTGPRDGEPSALFVVLFGRLEGASRPSVLGRGELIKQELVLADPDAAAALRDGATPTAVGIAWLTGDTPHSQLRAVREFGHREGELASEAAMWMIGKARNVIVWTVAAKSIKHQEWVESVLQRLC